MSMVQQVQQVQQVQIALYGGNSHANRRIGAHMGRVGAVDGTYMAEAPVAAGALCDVLRQVWQVVPVPM
jgi:hypothetical protein